MRLRRLEYKWLVGITFVLGLIMQILDVTILNVALATLGREFQVGPNTLQWALTGYMISLAVFVPSSGWIADRFGSKRTFQFAIVVFTAASVLCGLSISMEMLIASRVLQGVGGGMLVPVGQAMLFRAFPPEERAKASAVLAIPITVAPTLGPVLGGVLVQFASWRWIFFINVPVGVLALLFTIVFLVESRGKSPGRFDFVGFVLAGVGLATLLVGLEQGGHAGWTQPVAWISLLVSVVCLALLVWWENRVAEPMLDLRLLRQRLFSTGNALLICFTGANFSVLFLIPLYLQNVRGASPLTAGLILVPQALVMVAVTQVISRVYPVVGPRRLALAGFVVLIGLSLVLRVVNLDTPLLGVAALLMLLGVAMAILLTTLQTAAFAQISQAAMGQASSLFNASRQVATALGTAVCATVLVGATTAALPSGPVDAAAENQAQMAGYHGAFLVTAGFAVVGLLVTLRLRDSDAASTLSRRRLAKLTSKAR